MTMHPIEEGALVRLTRNTGRYRAGTEFVVSEYVEPRPVGEREAGEIDEPIYYGNINGGINNIDVPADAVEMVRTATWMDSRKLPTVGEILSAISVGSHGDDIEIDESTRSGDEVEVYGRTDEGLTFGFTLKVTAIWETDL